MSGVHCWNKACIYSPISPPLRAYLLDGKFFIATALASTLTKLCVRYVQQMSQVQSKNVSGFRIARKLLFALLLQAFCGEAMLIIASILHFGRSGLCKKVRSY